MSNDLKSVRERIMGILLSQCGRVDEELVGTGLVDSLKAISIALMLEREFGVSLEEISLDDMITVSALTEKIQAVVGRRPLG